MWPFFFQSTWIVFFFYWVVYSKRFDFFCAKQMWQTNFTWTHKNLKNVSNVRLLKTSELHWVPIECACVLNSNRDKRSNTFNRRASAIQISVECVCLCVCVCSFGCIDMDFILIVLLFCLEKLFKNETHALHSVWQQHSYFLDSILDGVFVFFCEFTFRDRLFQIVFFFSSIDWNV